MYVKFLLSNSYFWYDIKSFSKKKIYISKIFKQSLLCVKFYVKYKNLIKYKTKIFFYLGPKHAKNQILI